MKHDWKEQIKLTDVVWFQEGPGVRNTQYTKQGVKLLNVANLVDGKVDLSTSSRYISEEEAYGKYNHFLADEGDLILASSGIQVNYLHKKMGFIQKEHLPLCMNTSTIRFKPLDDKALNMRFFMYFLKSDCFKNQVAKQITGSAQLNFGPSHLKRMKIALPPIKEQEEICSLLDKLSLVIEKKKQQVKELDNLAQAIFYDMFGDPVENEKGWEVKKMGDVAPAVEYKGKHPQIANKYWLLNLDKVEAQTGRILSIDYYDYEEIGNSVVSFDKTNVLYSKLRPYLNKVVVPTQIGYATSELVPLQPNASLLDRQYIAYMLRSKLFVDYISGKVAGAKMPRVTMSVFRDFKVPIPPLSLQQSFAQKVESIERQKELINQSIREAQTLFDSRMEYYFGE